jgi:hypothetical protein
LFYKAQLFQIRNAVFLSFVGFKVLTAVVVKSSIYWDIMACSLLKVNDVPENYAASTFRVAEETKKPALCSPCYLAHAGFLLGLLFEPEDGNYIFLRNIG